MKLLDRAENIYTSYTHHNLILFYVKLDNHQRFQR